MANGYYDRLSGSGGGSGAMNDPTQTFAQLAAVMNSGAGPASGDTVYGAHSGKEQMTLTPYPGMAHRDWSGLAVDSEGSSTHLANFVASGAWAVSSGATYVANIGAGLTIANVADRWASRVDGDGRHYGWDAKGTVSAGALPAAGTWDYVSPNLYVRLSDGSNPAALTGEDAVMFVLNSNTPAVVMQAAGIVWNGVGTQGVSAITPDVRVGQIRHCSASSGIQYCLIAAGQGTEVKNLRLDGGEDHAMIIGSSGGAASQVTVENVDSWGMGKTVSAATFTAYSGAGGNVDGAVFRRCTARVYTLLDSAGNPLLFNQSWTPQATPLDLQGFYHHAGGGMSIANVLVDECVVRGYGSSSATHNRVGPFNANNTVALAGGSAYRDWNLYPVRHRRCKAFGCSTFNQSGNLAYKGCFFDMTKAALNTGDQVIGFIVQNQTVLFESCIFVCDLQRGASSRCLFWLLAGARLLCHYCTFINVRTGGSFTHDWFNVSSALAYGSNAGFRLECKGNIFAFADSSGGTTRRFLANDSGAPVGNYDFAGNLYYNVTAGQYSGDASRASAANWIANIDPTGITTVDPGLRSITSTVDGIAGKLSGASLLRNPQYKRLSAALAGRPSDGYGYDTTRWDGTIGADQQGSSNHRVLRSHRMDRAFRAV